MLRLLPGREHRLTALLVNSRQDYSPPLTTLLLLGNFPRNFLFILIKSQNIQKRIALCRDIMRYLSLDDWWSDLFCTFDEFYLPFK